MKLIPVSTLEHVEWLRVQRSRPELYKYFRQDMPLSLEHQAKWWRTLDKRKVRLFIVEENGASVGYVGFNPFNQYAMSAEFGMFILPEFQDNGLGRNALLELLRRGFIDYNLKNIYSDVLHYPGENRFDFYGSMGFEKHSAACQTLRYKKQGKWVPSIRFFMTFDIWRRIYGEDNPCGLERDIQKTAPVKAAKGRPGPGIPPSAHDIYALAEQDISGD